MAGILHCQRFAHKQKAQLEPKNPGANLMDVYYRVRIELKALGFYLPTKIYLMGETSGLAAQRLNRSFIPLIPCCKSC